MLTRRALAALTAAVITLPAFAADLSGTYTAEGMNPDGARYTGTAELLQADNTLAITWRVGDSSYVGSGPIEGRVVTINWGEPHPVYYVITQSGALHGTWADGTAVERLTPQR